jgi:hypothetical protein
VLPPTLRNQYSSTAATATRSCSSFDHERWGGAAQADAGPLLGLASLLLTVETGYPPEGENVPALGASSRRIFGPEALGLISLSLTSRRSATAATCACSPCSPARSLAVPQSWRGRGDDPFVREWLFPLYMNVQDPGEGWLYVGPFWGQRHDADGLTDWWLLGLLSRREESAGNTWRILGIPIVSP